MRINAIIFLVVAFFFLSCDKLNLCKDDNLSFSRINYDGTELKIEGYYFGDVNASNSFPFANIYYLYNNGVFLNSDASDLNKAEQGSIEVDVSNNFGKNVKGSWGVYRIEENEIEISRWQSSQSGCENEILERGEILNDSTFILDPRAKLEDRVFKFRALEQKPDSISNFIE